MDYPDIYFEPFWSEINAPLESGVADRFTYKSNRGIGYYSFVKRATPFLVDGIQYYDTVTPYGFNGPVVIQANDKQSFAVEFDGAFDQYCIKNNIIAEYVRFSPWLKNHSYFSGSYNIKKNGYTLSINLKGNFFMEEFSSKCRNQVRKAQKSGVVVEYDFLGSKLNDFTRLYEMMVVKNNISGYYDFSAEFFGELFIHCAQNIFMLHAVFNGKVISSAIFLAHREYLHYHFSGNDTKYSSLCGNNLILFEAAKWGKEHQKKELHLGGAHNESLYKYKRSFTRKEGYPYFIGLRVRNPAIYENLCQLSGMSGDGYFPKYRGEV